MAPQPSHLSPAELSYIHTSLASSPPLRPDGRSSTSFRPLQAETGVLPATNGSAHVSFSDGSECIVGVKLEVERTAQSVRPQQDARNGDGDAMDVDSKKENQQPLGRKEWISLNLNPSGGMRDDDPSLVYLDSMLSEPLRHTSLPSRLVINHRWHWHLYIDVLLISVTGLASYPLPLLSMATNLALRDTRVPRMKSEGEEDPVADDDWDASIWLYPRKGAEKPPITLLVITVSDNTIFDPSHSELAVADSILAVSVAPATTSTSSPSYQILSSRMIDTPARDTMRGVPRDGEVAEGREVPGVWKPRVGGVKRDVLKQVIKQVLSGGVAEDVMSGLEGFLVAEGEADRRVASS